MTRPARFTQADIQRAVRALQAVGETVTGVDIRPDGSFRVLTAPAQPKQSLSPFEAWEKQDGERAA